MLSIRLRKAGRSKRPYYRVVVTDSRSPRDGRFVEVIGHYDPRVNPAAFDIDRDRAEHWLKCGARPSDTVRSLLKRARSAAAADAQAG